MGIDLSVYKVPIYAMLSGRVSFINKTASDTAGIYIRVAHNADGTIPSVNPDNTVTGDFYSHYFHLNNIEKKPGTSNEHARGDIVNKGTLIATSGDTGAGGAHLDFGFDIYSGSNRLGLPGEYFISTSSWNSSMDLDFAQPPRIWKHNTYGTMLEVYIYQMGTSDKSAITPTLVIGEDGKTPATRLTMLQDSSDSKRYYAYLVGNGYDNKYVNAYIEIKKGDLGYITRPIEKYSSLPSKFYRFYVSTGLATMTSKDKSYNLLIKDNEIPQAEDAIELNNQ